MKKGNLLARDEADTVVGSALPDMFVTRGLPFMREKAVEMTRGQFNKTITPVIITITKLSNLIGSQLP